jgi:hypothetical protein
MLHRQMREATKEKRARKQAAMAKNNDEAVPSSAPTDGPLTRIKFKFSYV